jgi:hypothetical protein
VGSAGRAKAPSAWGRAPLGHPWLMRRVFGGLSGPAPQNSTVLTTVLGSSKVAMRIC